MIIPIIISYVANVIWLGVPLRQIRNNYFFYFLLFSFSSAFSLLDHFIPLHPAYFYLGVSFFLIISLFNFKKFPHYILFLIGVLIISIILPFLLSITAITICLIIQHAVIFFIILKRTILYSYREEKLNLFQFVLLLYEITLVTRFLVILHNVRTSLVFFYLTGAFGILIGIFFLFYNEKNSPKLSMASKDIIDD
jgi:hypothetical protein